MAAFFGFAGTVAAQEIGIEAEVQDDVATEVSRDEWRQRINQARQRAKVIAKERRERPELYAPPPEDMDLVSSQRVLNDDSLQSGDIVSTKQGLFVFRGRNDRQRLKDDFIALPSR